MSPTPAFNIPGYELIRELGVGGMATVHLAIQSSLDRKVAIKVMRRNIDDAEKFERRFLVEGRTLAKLPHRNIVAVYDIVKSDAATYISMEYLEGGTLHEKMRGGLSLAEAVAIVVQIAGALQFAHDHGIVHRDLKPANIMFRDELTPVLTDFGIARQQDATQTRLTQTGMLVGTPTYMSPEQINALDVDGRSDLYSLGVMFYELLTGRPPFHGETPIAVLMAHLTSPPPPLPPQFAEFQPVLDRMLAKSRDERYANLKEFTKALKAIVVHNDRLWARLQADPNQSSSEQLRALGFSVSSSTALDPVQPGAPSKRQLPQPPPTAVQVGRPQVDAGAPTQISNPALRPASTAHRSRRKRGPWIGAAVMAVLLVAMAAWLLMRPDEDIDPRIRGEIDARLIVVDRYIGEKKLTPPPIGDNALDLLQAVQQRAPNYSGTQQRTAALVAALKAEARRRNETGEFIDAEAALGFAGSLAPDDAEVAALRGEIMQARTRSEQAAQVKELLAKAEAAAAAGRDLGADGAYGYLRQAAQIAPGDAALGAARQKLLSRLLAPGRDALAGGNPDAAQVRLDALAPALGNDAEWRKLRDDIATARVAAARAAEIATLQSRFAAQLRVHRYAEPAGDNALESLNALRQMDAKQADLRATELARALVADARDAQRGGDATMALAMAELALRIRPDAADALALKREVEGRLSADQRRVAELLGQAQQAISEQRYFEPAGQNALASLDALLKLDPKHGEARRMRDGLPQHALGAARALARTDRLDEALALARQVGQRYRDQVDAQALVAELQREQAQRTAELARRSILERVLAAAAQRPLDARAFDAALVDVAALLKSNARDVDALTARERLRDALRESAESASTLSALAEVDALHVKFRRQLGDVAKLATTIASARTRLQEEERVRLAATAGDLLLLALPWGEVESVTDLQRKTTVELPNDRVTPLRLRVPAGVYRIQYKHPDGARASAQATVRANTETLSSSAFAALDAKEYLRRAGLQ